MDGRTDGYQKNIDTVGNLEFPKKVFGRYMLYVIAYAAYDMHFFDNENNQELKLFDFGALSKNAYAITCDMYLPHTFWGIQSYLP